MIANTWHRPLASFLGILALATIGSRVRADQPAPKKKEEPSYIRVIRDAKKTPTSMDTSIVSLSNGKSDDEKVTVDLISAVHVGEKSYYEELNKRFDTYEVVLYELVAPEGATPADRPKDGNGHPVAAMQDGLKELLGLEHQLNIVDYEKKNFVHADMSPEDFEKAMKERGESFLSMFFRMAFEGMKAQSKNGSAAPPDDLGMLFALMSPNRPRAMKRIMANQFEQLDTITAGLDGKNGSAIVTDRNSKCLDVLTKQLEAGKKKIGIFYGAAHMPDMEKRLIKDFDMKRGEITWLIAWDMSEKPTESDFLKQLQKNREAKKKKEEAKQPASTP